MSARKTPKCGATKKNGEPCGMDAGWGTDHPGHGTCKLHGGSTPDAILHAAKEQAIVMGVAVDVEPHEALLQCIRITAGEVMYCQQRIAELQPEEAVGHPTEIIRRQGSTGENGRVDVEEVREKVPMMNIWIRARAASIDRLAKYSKMALDAGVNERRVRMAEGMASELAPIIKAIFDELELTERQREIAPAILKRNLLALEGEAMAVPDPRTEEAA